MNSNSIQDVKTGHISTDDIWNISDLVGRLAALYPAHFRGDQGEAWGQEFKRLLKDFTSRQLTLAWSDVMDGWERQSPPRPAAFKTAAKQYSADPISEHRPREREVTRGIIRNRQATAGMMRAVMRAINAPDSKTAHAAIRAVAPYPERWPDWLDEHGDDEWKNLPEEKKRAVQNIEIVY
jgi:hypothetical protein